MGSKIIYITLAAIVLICALFFSFCFTKRADDTNIEIVMSKVESYKGKRVRWKGKLFGEGKANEKTVWLVVKRGYHVSLDLNEPLKKSIDKETEIWFEGDVDGKFEFTTYSADRTPLGQAQVVILKNATVEVKSLSLNLLM